MENQPAPPASLEESERQALTYCMCRQDYGEYNRLMVQLDQKYQKWDIQASYNCVASHPARYLMMAAHPEDREVFPILKNMLARGLEPNGRGKDNELNIPPPLYYAIKHNLPTAVQLLLNYGADPNVYIKTATCRAPIFFTALDTPGRKKIIKMLLAGGANINGKASTGETLVPYMLQHAAHYSDRELHRQIKLFFKHGYRPAPTLAQSQTFILDKIRPWIREQDGTDSAQLWDSLGAWVHGENPAARRQALRLQRWAKWLGGRRTRPARINDTPGLR